MGMEAVCCSARAGTAGVGEPVVSRRLIVSPGKVAPQGVETLWPNFLFAGGPSALEGAVGWCRVGDASEARGAVHGAKLSDPRSPVRQRLWQ